MQSAVIDQGDFVLVATCDCFSRYYIYGIRKKYVKFKEIWPASNLKFFWTPSYMRIIGNENVDSFGKKATGKKFKQINVIPYFDLYYSTNQAAMKKKQKRLLKISANSPLYLN